MHDLALAVGTHTWPDGGSPALALAILQPQISAVHSIFTSFILQLNTAMTQSLNFSVLYDFKKQNG